MKKSIFLSIVILAIGLIAGLMQRQQLTALRQDRAQLAAQAVKLGITATLPNPSGQPQTTKREQQDRETLIRSVVAQMRDYVRALEDDETIDGENSPAFQEQGWDLMERLMDLDPDDLKDIIASLQADEDLPGRRKLIDLSVRMLAENHPAAALPLFIASDNLMKEMDNGEAVFLESLANWAKKDPNAAMAWIQKNSPDVPCLDNEQMMSSLLAGAAQEDPQQAFKLLSTAGTNMEDALQAITGSAKSPEARTAILTALRNHLTTISEPTERDSLRDQAIGGFAESFGGEGFASVENWISNQNFSARECDALVRSLTYETTKTDTGKWVNWMAETLPPEKLQERVEKIVSPWAKEDFQAVGIWLNEQPNGPAKTSAVSAYAKTVGDIEPEAAAQWAVTMPPGQEREDTLNRIYKNWLTKDPAAANAALERMGLPAETVDSLRKQSGVNTNN